MKRAYIAVAVMALACVFANGALASGGVSIEQGNSWDVFSPNPINPGDLTSVSVTTFQNGNVGSNATVSFTGLKAAGLTLVSNNDGSASCTMQNQNKAVCSYTDFAHSAKSDGYTFQLAGNATPGTYSIRVHVVIQGSGQASELLSITTPIPAPVVQPPLVVGSDSPPAIFLCSAGGAMGVYSLADAAELVTEGFREPNAIAGNADGANNVGAYMLSCGAAGAVTGYVGDGGSVFGLDYGPAREELGFYSIVG
jgi:hypothetical protein